MTKRFLVYFILVILLFANTAYACDKCNESPIAPGSELAKSDLNKIKKSIDTVKYMCVNETDKNKRAVLENLSLELNSYAITIMELSSINESYHKSIKNRDNDQVNDNVPCAACGGTGMTGDEECGSCNGHGNVWSPDQAGHEKKCGRCSGTGKIKSGSLTMTCPKCHGSGWAGATAYPSKLKLKDLKVIQKKFRTDFQKKMTRLTK